MIAYLLTTHFPNIVRHFISIETFALWKTHPKDREALKKYWAEIDARHKAEMAGEQSHRDELDAIFADALETGRDGLLMREISFPPIRDREHFWKKYYEFEAKLIPKNEHVEIVFSEERYGEFTMRLSPAHRQLFVRPFEEVPQELLKRHIIPKWVRPLAENLAQAVSKTCRNLHKNPKDKGTAGYIDPKIFDHEAVLKYWEELVRLADMPRFVSNGVFVRYELKRKEGKIYLRRHEADGRDPNIEVEA